MTGSASAGRPSAENRTPRLASERGEVGAVAVRAGGGQLPVHGDGFLGDRQRVGRAAQRGEPDAEVVQPVRPDCWPGVSRQETEDLPGQGDSSRGKDDGRVRDGVVDGRQRFPGRVQTHDEIGNIRQGLAEESFSVRVIGGSSGEQCHGPSGLPGIQAGQARLGQFRRRDEFAHGVQFRQPVGLQGAEPVRLTGPRRIQVPQPPCHPD